MNAAVGIESVWTFEHVILPVDYESKYPYNPSGKMGAPPETNLIDPLIALTAIAAHTSTLRLATGVNILPQTNPLYLAKQAASLDFVSGGRFMLGLGIGSYMAVQGDLTLGAMVAFVSLLGNVIAPLESFSGIVQLMQRVGGSSGAAR